MESLSHQRGCTSLIHAKNLSFYVGHSSASRVDVGERPVLGLPIDTNWKWFSLYLSFPVRVPEKLEQCTTKMTNRFCMKLSRKMERIYSHLSYLEFLPQLYSGRILIVRIKCPY
ncbi:hypothetical protein MPTK1_8g09690 [Marchantia polymorpha subsp. ruderalis]|uniref:Uncharacterized protein n=1 Tax=Marchantia polymorpha TaxID=3197 RepID=A0A2R6XN36_MARPO|nr:hypothetical protein MARPO_0008s0252 [Marchantia polymorpha]BBN19326.1 hypothetical protein Mp_8g09690 [Marchantia polymorpha subsp. ruderalis]|eukprot:PTQ47507.1 hypothetical protein MARPO_0008s0252 [Marchantia polymorpha]